MSKESSNGPKPTAKHDLPNHLAGLSREQKLKILHAEIARDPSILEDPTIATYVEVTMRSHRGPLPAPEDLADYEKACPGGADRIISMAEKQQHHIIDMNSADLSGNFREARFGQMLAFGLGAIGLVCGTICVLKGHDAAGAALGGATLVALVGVFLKGRQPTSPS